jgi:hypothetical protein
MTLLMTAEGAVATLNSPVINCCALRLNQQAATALRTPAVGSIGRFATLTAFATHTTQYE